MQASDPRRYYSAQESLNSIFRHYNITFRDPNRIVNILEQAIRDELGVTQFADEDDYYDRVQAMSDATAVALHDILEDIGGLVRHRHRVDAANILGEVQSRIFGGQPPNTLIPTPREPAYEGPGAKVPDTTPQEVEDGFRDALLARAGQLLWKPGDDFPEPWELPRAQMELSYLPPINDDALRLIAQGTAATNAARTAVQNMLSSGEHPLVYRPPIYLDDPEEICLAMPEDCPFITTQVPISNRMAEILAQSWPRIQIWDYRLGERKNIGCLSQNHYIYQLVSLVRDIVTDPDVAKAYTIIFRAHPARYATSSNDEIANEDPPTTEEIECVMAFMARTFPEIEIATDMEPGVVAFHDRLFLNTIQLNGDLFNDIEQKLREGESVGHLLYHIFVTIIHELGHWFYSCIYLRNTVMPGVLRTPRKLRLVLLASGIVEDLSHPESNYEDLLYGEMGQVIEWLIFGYICDTNINRPGVLEVTCWGSNSSQGWQRIVINSFAAARLLATRPPIRMTAPRLRNFLAFMAEEERNQTGPQPDTISGEAISDLEMTDVDSEYSGHDIQDDDDDDRRYRRAIQRVRRESQEARKGLTPLQPIPPLVVRRRRPVVEPLGPPGVSWRFLNIGHTALVAMSCFMLYICYYYDQLHFIDRRNSLIIRLAVSFDCAIGPILLLLLLAVYFRFPIGRLLLSSIVR